MKMSQESKKTKLKFLENIADGIIQVFTVPRRKAFIDTDDLEYISKERSRYRINVILILLTILLNIFLASLALGMEEFTKEKDIVIIDFHSK